MIAFNINKNIIFEDDYLIAINKPAGLLSIEDGYDIKKINLRSILKEIYGSIWAVHRLDKGTSGIIIFAKDENSHRELNSSFSNRETKKQYKGIVDGFPIWNSHKVNLPLRINGDKNHRTVIDLNEGKTAITEFTVIRKYYRNSYLDIFPETGFTHQIRAHLSALGFPILGDDLYNRTCKLNDSDIEVRNREQSTYFLHASSLIIPHPILGTPLELTASLPIEFTNMLTKLENGRRC
jgi:tRNA pseudouridine32 synthase/23S rRNA pseudouridine746 synthase